MKNTILKAGMLVAVMLAGAALNGNSQTVSGKIAGGSVTRGTAAKATVTLSLPGGLHVNSNRPGSEYAIATTVRPTAARGIKIGRVSYPRGHDRKFEFSEKSINVYDGRTSFTFTVTVPTTYARDTVAVTVTVRYQACTNEVCYAPKSKKVTLSARVKSAAPANN